jgi:HAD superfamily hydrolase (TIGR01509 family)
MLGIIFDVGLGVIFDVDGTLVDSNDAHATAFQQAFAEHGFEIPFRKIRGLIGKGSDKLIPELIGRYDEAIGERKSEIFKSEFLPRLRPFPGATTLVRRLHAMDIKLAVASSAAKDELDALLGVACVVECFHAKTSTDDAEHSKPDPDIVQTAVRKLGLPASLCLMIGDTPYDAQAACRAGVQFIGLRCGGWPDADLQPSRAVYEDPADMLVHMDDWLVMDSRHATAG